MLQRKKFKSNAASSPTAYLLYVQVVSSFSSQKHSVFPYREAGFS